MGGSPRSDEEKSHRRFPVEKSHWVPAVVVACREGGDRRLVPTMIERVAERSRREEPRDYFLRRVARGRGLGLACLTAPSRERASSSSCRERRSRRLAPSKAESERLRQTRQAANDAVHGGGGGGGRDGCDGARRVFARRVFPASWFPCSLRAWPSRRFGPHERTSDATTTHPRTRVRSARRLEEERMV